MATSGPQTKRIKLEHSYAFHVETSALSQPEFGAAAIKQEDEDPLKLNHGAEVVETIKIEIDDVTPVKSEPAVEEGAPIDPTVKVKEENSICDDENTGNEPQPEDNFSVESILIADVHSIKNEVDTETADENSSGEDPLPAKSKHEAKAKFEVESTPEVEPEEKQPQENQKPNQRRKPKNNLKVKAPPVEDVESRAISRLQRDKDNLQSQLKKLRSELRAAKTREKALQTELGARRMSEIYLQDKNVELKDQVQVYQKKEQQQSKLMKELKLKLVLFEAEKKTMRLEQTQRLKHEYGDTVQKLNAALKEKENEYKQMEYKYGSISRHVATITSRCTSHKLALDVTKQKLLSVEQQFANSVKACTAAQLRVTELTNELALSQRTGEELQKALLAEKKMGLFFVKERDQLLEEHDNRFKEATKEVGKLKQTVKSLSVAVNEKTNELLLQKQAAKGLMANYQAVSLELKNKMEELEKKEKEWSQRTCEYCGF
ncbi:hypothetical protein NQ315_007401 [Exocentrus adspersus]|uniref:Alpha-taxilin n=1 Tax=Exocentrus adspersus TaxID=1586481 RepID=A0AAV8VHP7_9CUCU|nr:hypothetical protein NQ315_007401 [Exocentrus adspersus]